MLAQSLLNLAAALIALLRRGPGKVNQKTLTTDAATDVAGGVGSFAKYLHEIVLVRLKSYRETVWLVVDIQKVCLAGTLRDSPSAQRRYNFPE